MGVFACWNFGLGLGVFRGYVSCMTATAERVLQDIRTLPTADLREVWQQVSQLVAEQSSPPVSTPPPVSTQEFEAALEEVTGCTAETGSLERLLTERRREAAQEQAWLGSRTKGRTGG
jgi:hypothetical protein